ncbi:icea protein [Caudoviricetes sp.]|nr:icea protein [Caudoviricetes sp.]
MVVMELCTVKDCDRKMAYKSVKMCRKHRDRIYYAGKRRDRNEYFVQYSARRKAEVFKHYGAVCACCGEQQVLFLSVDHINNDGNSHVTSTGKRINGVYLYSQIVSQGYPDTYQILCMNCNWGKRMNKGVCPHLNNVIH